MKIDCYISRSCSSEAALRENISSALKSESAVAEINFSRISDDEAERLGLRGSPSVLINGEDIMPGDIAGFS